MENENSNCKKKIEKENWKKKKAVANNLCHVVLKCKRYLKKYVKKKIQILPKLKKKSQFKRRKCWSILTNLVVRTMII